MIKQALLHVHTANTAALDWYQHRGFKVQLVTGTASARSRRRTYGTEGKDPSVDMEI
jgi:ribosomal protein S18 acetylase RimI-like enzyme